MARAAAPVENPVGMPGVWDDLCLVYVYCRGPNFTKAWKQNQEEEQTSSFLSDHLIYNMLKGYYGILAHWCQKVCVYHSFERLHLVDQNWPFGAAVVAFK